MPHQAVSVLDGNNFVVSDRHGDVRPDSRLPPHGFFSEDTRFVSRWRLTVQGQLSDEVELYHRTYTTLLRSSGETLLRVLEPSHRSMNSSLHPLAATHEPDLGAFLYAMRRLPAGIWQDFMASAVKGMRMEGFHAPSFSGYDKQPERSVPLPTPPAPPPPSPPPGHQCKKPPCKPKP